MTEGGSAENKKYQVFQKFIDTMNIHYYVYVLSIISLLLKLL